MRHSQIECGFVGRQPDSRYCKSPQAQARTDALPSTSGLEAVDFSGVLIGRDFQLRKAVT